MKSVSIRNSQFGGGHGSVTSGGGRGEYPRGQTEICGFVLAIYALVSSLNYYSLSGFSDFLNVGF